MKGMKDIKCSVNWWLFQVLLAGIVRKYFMFRQACFKGHKVEIGIWLFVISNIFHKKVQEKFSPRSYPLQKNPGPLI